MTNIPFNRASAVGRELEYIQEAIDSGHISGDGIFTKKCHAWIEENIGGHALLTHSCTGALEMACILADLQPGDEVILPSYTFVSTANAVALRGAVPVFVDIRPDTLNIDENLIEAAITEKTKAIIAVHYAGVVAEMNPINAIAKKYGLFVIEDAAQAMFSTYHGKQAGTLSDASAFSYHETKNILTGEGGTLILNDKDLYERSEVIREKGTNRSQFFRGSVDKYTWVDIGSSYLPSELIAAYLYAQLENSKSIIQYRLDVCAKYAAAFSKLEADGLVQMPVVPEHCQANGHMFYLILNSLEERSSFIAAMREVGIMTPFHYVPLHSAPAGRKYGRSHGELVVTSDLSERLVRLPVFYNIGAEQDRVIEMALQFFQ